MLALAVVLITTHALVPGYLMRKAHLEIALVANDMRIHILCAIVELTILAGVAEAPSEVGFGREMVQEEVAVVVGVKEVR